MATDTNVTTRFPFDIHIHLSQEQAGGYQKDGHGPDESDSASSGIRRNAGLNNDFDKPNSESAILTTGSRATSSINMGNVELNRLGRESYRAAVEGVKERSPSPHCHFALPRLPSSSGTISRRSSLSIGARTRVGIIGQDEPLISDSEVDGERPSTTTAAVTSASPCTSGLPGSAIIPPTPFQLPSRTPSISRPPSAQSSHNIPPPLSRRPSTDAVSHHYIEARRNGTSREKRGIEIDSNSSLESVGISGGTKRQEKEVLGFDELRSRESAAWRDERNPTHQFTSPSISPPPSVSTSAAPSIVAIVVPIVSPQTNPTTGTTSTRRTLFSEPPAAMLERTLLGGRCRPVALNRRMYSTAGKEKEGLVAEPREAAVGKEGSEDDAEHGRDEEDDDEVEEEEDDDDENDEEREDEGEDGGRSHEEGEGGEGDEEDDEEDEEDEGVVRATSTGAGIEVVHWHQEEGALTVEPEDLVTIVE